jgi:hypothetical protein
MLGVMSNVVVSPPIVEDGYRFLREDPGKSPDIVFSRELEGRGT